MSAKNSSIATPSADQQPFWIDVPFPYFDQPQPDTQKQPFEFLSVYKYYPYILIIFAIIALAQFISSTWICVVAIGFALLPLVIGTYAQRRTNALRNQALEIQQRARDQIRASIMGSAIHVAGHPLLAREQPVVLALRDDQLLIFGYNHTDPIDVLPLDQLQSIHAVVYDDDRVPHIEVIDNQAQALQLTFAWQGQSCTCLFRRMLKVRPIDWYHAIQQARLSLSPT